MNGKMSTSKNSSVYTLTSPSFTSRNDKVCSLKNPIHDQIKYPGFSKNQARDVCCSSDLMNT